MLDAGWFGETVEGETWFEKRGDWDKVNPELFPSGMKAMCDKAKAVGILPGMWCEIEAVGKDAELNRTHEKIIAKREGRSLGYVCFGSKEGRKWAKAADGFQSVAIQSVDGLRLWAAVVPAKEETHRWVICVHGFSDSHISMGVYGKHYHEAGWNVLLPDQRGYGNSEGNCVGWGFNERLDLVGWISWVVRRDPEA